MITSVTAASLVPIHKGVWKRALVEGISAVPYRALLPVPIVAKFGQQVRLDMGYLSSKSCRPRCRRSYVAPLELTEGSASFSPLKLVYILL